MPEPTAKEIEVRAYQDLAAHGSPRKQRERMLAPSGAGAAQRGQIQPDADARYAVTDKNRTICFGLGWICEKHPKRACSETPWIGM